jgi:hypothetical protein
VLNSKFKKITKLIGLVLASHGKPLSKRRICQSLAINERTLYRYLADDLPFLIVKNGFVSIKIK